MIHWKRQTTGTKQMSGFYGLGWTTGQINESGKLQNCFKCGNEYTFAKTYTLDTKNSK